MLELNKVYNMDCIEGMRLIDDNSIDSIVTDPPYELGFMGKSWDNTGISNNKEMWAECLRILKPGGYLLSFGGTRTYHRMACAIEDAGFEVRDMIEWVYSTGFPKSLNIGKAVDKLGGRGLGQEIGSLIKKRRIELGYSTIKLAEIGGFYGNTNHGGTVSNWETGNGSITPEQFNKLIDILGLENEPIIANERELLGKHKTDMGGLGGERLGQKGGEITKGTSEWEGWGTALKPAHEPICMARKPLAEKTVAENVLKWGTGGINIDGSRVETTDSLDGGGLNSPVNGFMGNTENTYKKGTGFRDDTALGRFPANLILDNSEEVRECFPETGKGSDKPRNRNTIGSFGMPNDTTPEYADSGNASRFFKSIIYQAKASKSERNKGCEGLEDITVKSWHFKCKKCGKTYSEQSYKSGCHCENPDVEEWTGVSKNNHPTVKPIALMEYLIKMVTPKGGTVLDPFMGSGTTGCASKKNGYNYIGFELDKGYREIANKRIQSIQSQLF